MTEKVIDEQAGEISGGGETEAPQAGKDSRAHPVWGARGTAAATIAAELCFDHVSRSFDGFNAVRDFSLDVAAGQIVCLLGPSGCGKTTLLRIASGIERPTSGRVLLNGKEVSGAQSFVPPEKRNVGLMFQDFALFPHLTVLQNVAFGLKGLPQAEADKVAGAALERVGLIHYARNYPHTLSGGEQQRVALARAVAPRPSVLLMDEPFSGLDSRLRDEMREETRAVLRETRATCIIVTHQPEEAMQLGDVIAVMRAGKLVQTGGARELYHSPNNIFVARMFSAMNEIPSKVVNGKMDTALGVFDAGGLADGTDAVMCVRERGIQLVPAGDGIAGRVVHVKFLGDAAVVEIAIDGLDKPLRARVAEPDCPERGVDVGLVIDDQMVLVLEADKN